MRSYARISKRVLLIGFLAGAAVFFYDYAVKDVEHLPTVESDLDSLVTSIELFEDMQGRYPDTLQELVAADLLDQYPRDFWGRPYYYSTFPPPTVRIVREYYVWTLGRDGTVRGHGPDRDHVSWPD